MRRATRSAEAARGKQVLKVCAHVTSPMKADRKNNRFFSYLPLAGPAVRQRSTTGPSDPQRSAGENSHATTSRLPTRLRADQEGRYPLAKGNLSRRQRSIPSAYRSSAGTRPKRVRYTFARNRVPERSSRSRRVWRLTDRFCGVDCWRHTPEWKGRPRAVLPPGRSG